MDFKIIIVDSIGKERKGFTFSTSDKNEIKIIDGDLNIQEKCVEIHRYVHQNYNKYNLDDTNYNKFFTSLDVIEDSQSAIDEFIRIDESYIKGRSTLYIYGVLQSLYCQQDGLFSLVNSLSMYKNLNKIYDFFKKFNLDPNIREIRNDIAGHPTNRTDNKFYFISKGVNSKYKFEYGGYKNDQFIHKKVNLEELIENQNKFCKSVLIDVENHMRK